jgi:hypothetical protein
VLQGIWSPRPPLRADARDLRKKSVREINICGERSLFWFFFLELKANLNFLFSIAFSTRYFFWQDTENKKNRAGRENVNATGTWKRSSF